MKVVFLEDVPHVASAGEIREVADGYGRNFLIPKKLAVLAMPGVANQVETQRRIKIQHQAQEIEELRAIARQLEGTEVNLKAKVGANDRLYGSITNADIAVELQSITGLDIDKRKIELAKPIRQLGSYEVIIKLAKDISSSIKVMVTEEEDVE